MYTAAKTVADCLKYLCKMGPDVAVEALRDCRRQRKCSNGDLWRYAKICRVANVMKPYLEGIVGGATLVASHPLCVMQGGTSRN